MDRQYVGIDFHRRRSVIVRLASDGERRGVHRIANDPFELAAVIAECGKSPEVVIEAADGWYWAVDLLQELGTTVHLANTRALNGVTVRSFGRACASGSERGLLHAGTPVCLLVA